MVEVDPQDNADLRSDVRRLGDLLGASLVRQESQNLLDLVEAVRKAVRDGGGEEILDRVTTAESVLLVRAFSTYFNLANVAEQVHRARILASQRAAGGSWLSRAIDRIIDVQNETKEFTREDIQHWVDHFSVRPVFTAHPTEAARRSVLSKMTTIADLLDKPDSITRERRLAEAVDLLWQTNELRLGRPEPLDEATNALYYLDDLFKITIPEVLDDFARELARIGVIVNPTSRPLSYGSWIGGDRDGNPHITPAVTTEAIVLQTGHFIRAMLSSLDELRQALSVSTRIAGASEELKASVAQDLSFLPEVEDRFIRLNVEEPYRLKATAIRHKLILTQRRHAAGAKHAPHRDYKDTAELLADLMVMRESLKSHRGELIATGLLERIIRTVSSFGLTHATMDIREHSDAHHHALEEIFGDLYLDRTQKINDELTHPSTITNFDHIDLSAKKTLDTFVAVHDLIGKFGPEVIETYIISMTKSVPRRLL